MRWARWARSISAATWILAASLAGIIFDMPLHARTPARGGPLVPSVQPFPGNAKPAPPKARDKTIEYAPWEQVPT
jgi:hypothetical protein